MRAMVRRVALTSTFARALSLARAACLEASVRRPGWRDHFLRGFGGKFSTVPSKKNFNGRDGACCEYRLTWRLVGRRVPFQIVPIPFVGAGSKDFVRQWDKLLKRPQNRSVLC